MSRSLHAYRVLCYRAKLKHQPTSCLCAPAKPELPVTTVIKREKNVCHVTFSPNIVQQAKISTSGLLGDFVIRYDVQRDMGIGDIQVRRAHFFQNQTNKQTKKTPEKSFSTPNSSPPDLILVENKIHRLSGFLPKCCFYL